MTEQAGTDGVAPPPWRLMVLALAGALIPPEPVRLGPVLPHRGKAERAVIVASFSARWQAPHGVRAHHQVVHAMNWLEAEGRSNEQDKPAASVRLV